MSADRPFDVVVFGATGFTGRLACEYLAAKMKTSPFKWAIAGRNRGKLEEIKKALEAIEPACAKVGVIEARADDRPSLARMAASARVVLTTVGPYAEHGEPVVEACVAEGADYVDITGEPDFVDRTIERFHEAAQAKGIRVVSCCGFDSIPHDLGVFYTVKQLKSRDQPVKVEGFVRATGTFSGGTWQSAIGAFSNITKKSAPKKKPNGASARSVRGIRPKIRYEKSLGAWACPLPTIDPQVVLRSARALDAYGPSFEYGHYAQVRSGVTLVAGVAGVGALVALAQLPPTRALLKKVRSSGEGPSPEERARSKFKVTFVATTPGERLVASVSGGDPGYTETAKMVSESALCLALDRAKLPKVTGVLTPAVAMGDALLERLQREGIRFEVIER
jgi:short subunit dehydrogenase-like uncharacterized protein